MSAHPLSERLRAYARCPEAFDWTRNEVALECADALDSAATFEADVLRIRGEIEWLTEERETLRTALAACVRAMTVATEDGGEAWNDALALARAALPAERDEKERR